MVDALSALPPFTKMTAAQFQTHLDQRSVNTHDAASVAQWFSKDGVQRAVASDVVVRGREAIEANMARLFAGFPDFHVEVRDFFSSDDRMCAQCTVRGTHGGDFGGLPATGRRIEVDWCLVFRVGDDGLVTEEVLYGDAATMLRQLGVLPDA